MDEKKIYSTNINGLKIKTRVIIQILKSLTQTRCVLWLFNYLTLSSIFYCYLIYCLITTNDLNIEVRAQIQMPKIFI